jgi:hypothetical protein
MKQQVKNSTNSASELKKIAAAPEEKLARYAIIAAEIPEYLTKQMSLAEDGNLIKESAGWLTRGKASVYDVNSLEEFADSLLTLRHNEAITYGLPQKMDVSLVTSNNHKELGEPDDPVARTNEHFNWADGPGIMMIDVDPEDGEEPLSPSEVRRLITEAVPGLAAVKMLTWPSASSHIVNEESGEIVKGAAGLRIWFLVEEAGDIPRVGEVLFQRLWLTGNGYVKLSKSGARLKRSIIDQSVYQPSRLDFAAGALCHAPLKQERGNPEILPGEIEFVDTKARIPDLNAREKAEFEKLVQAAYDELEEQAEIVADEHAEIIALRNLRKKGINVTKKTAKKHKGRIEGEKAAVRRAMKGRILPEGFVLLVKTGNKVVEHTVAEILSRPDLFDEALCLDPIEPEYDDYRVVGKIFVHDEQHGFLHSFARGETTYTLRNMPGVLHTRGGDVQALTDQVLDVFRADPKLFDYGPHLVTVDHGKHHVIDAALLPYEIGKRVGILKHYKSTGPSMIDAPKELCAGLTSLKDRRGLKKLKAVIKNPTLRPDGTLLDKAGYDDATGVFFDPPDGTTFHIPNDPTEELCRSSLATLMAPFEGFPFKSAADKGVLLAGLLTASIRGSLPTAPGFAFDAPVKGSGKTKLAFCLGLVSGDDNPAVSPVPKGIGKEDEMRKRLMAGLVSGKRSMIFDNLTGDFHSDSHCAMLTSETYSDRKLGVTQVIEMPTNMMMLYTGNNIRFAGDMLRRVLVSRIDPEMENPALRKFSFDPVKYTREHRHELIEAALTLMRGALSAGYSSGVAPLGSYEDWDHIVRRTVLWVGDVIAPDQYGDPIDLMIKAMADDDEAASWIAVLERLFDVFGEEPFKAGDILKMMGSGMATVGPGNQQSRLALKAAVEEHRPLIANSGKWTAKGIGKMLEQERDKWYGGRCLKVLGKADNTNVWAVKKP